MIAPSEASSQRRYRLIAEIGRGGMAEVYLAVSQGPAGFNKLVVIKKALPGLALQPEFLTMFLDEARLGARMNHPNVVQTYEFGEEDGRHFIAMEYLDGQPYSRILNRMRGQAGGLEALALGHHLRILLDTLAGLHHAHELRDFDGSPLYVVHRDVTPQNVFVTYDGSIKVVDFGIAKAQDSSSRTVTGEIKGKVTYMSPEQVRGEPLDRRADLFAVGVMLWEVIAGRRMWKELPDITIVHELLRGHVPSLREVAPHAPPELLRICERALSPDREGRYPSALAMQRELEEFCVTSRARVDGPEVGRVVSEWFEQERRKVREVVEAQLGSLRWTGENPAASNLPMIPAPTNSVTGKEYFGVGVAGDASLARSPVSVVPTNSGAALPMPSGGAASKRSGAGLVVGLGLVAAILAGLALSFTRPWDRGAPASSAPAASETATAPSSAQSGQDAITLKVRATPAEAKIYLDGVLLGAGSFDGKVLRGEGERVLKVEAEGYTAKEERLTLRSDLMTSFALEKAEPTASASATATAPTTALRPFTPRPKPTGRGIDDESPYKKTP